jgi:3-isopropylmalate/(R)-2-methylmalate dehydratase large subunit
VARTLFDQLWESHVVQAEEGGACLIYIDRQLLHEVSTPQAFATLDAKGLKPRRPRANLAVPDHAVPTRHRGRPIRDPQARAQLAQLERNAHASGVPLIPLTDPRQGIVHVIGPELGFTLPGITLACGDSHTTTHGAFGALAFGIGASECAVALATQCLRQHRPRQMRVRFEGALSPCVGAKDLALALIARIGTNGAAGHAVEYDGPAVEALSMEGRMTLCNMSIEAGTKVGLIAPDETTFAYINGRPMAPAGPEWDRALAYWRTLKSDADAVFDRIVTVDAAAVAPHVTWGASPQDAAPVDGRIPDPAACAEPAERRRVAEALRYMGLAPGAALQDVRIDAVFIGSCTNGRIEDLRAAASVLRGRKVAEGVRALVVPGSTAVRRQAEAEGLDRVFRDAGFEWREAGCSMCVAMNEDRLSPGERCASTSNRNFEGRQGPGGRTHLMGPAMAAAAATEGRIVDVRRMLA